MNTTVEDVIEPCRDNNDVVVYQQAPRECQIEQVEKTQALNNGARFFNMLSTIKNELVGVTQTANEINDLKNILHDKENETQVLRDQVEILREMVPISQAQELEDRMRIKRIELEKNQELQKLRTSYHKVSIQLRCFLSKKADLIDRAGLYGFTEEDLKVGMPS